ncbi:MAG: NosD domain-containing protein [Halobacteriaceae archaeon]
MRRLSVALSILVLIGLSIAPFMVHPSAQTDVQAVPFDKTKSFGMPAGVIREAAETPLVIPKLQAIYSRYSYVVGYYTIDAYLAGTPQNRQNAFGYVMGLFVTSFSGTHVSVNKHGYLEMSQAEVTHWIRATEAYYVVNSRARLPTRPNVIVPFSTRRDAQAFVNQYGGKVVTWNELSQRSIDRLGRSKNAWRREKQKRLQRITTIVTSVNNIRYRSRSVTVGKGASSLAKAIAMAPANSTVYIPPGTYHVSELIINKSLTLRGAGPNKTVIIGDKNGSVLTVRAPKTAIVNLRIKGIGDTRVGTPSPANVPVNRSSWKYRYWTTHGYGDAAIVFDTAKRSLVSNVQISTSANGIIARNSPNVIITQVRIAGAKSWQEGFLNIVSLGAPIIVQNSTLLGNKVGVYTAFSSGMVVQNTTMEGMMVGIFNLFAIRMTVIGNTISDTWNGIYIETPSTDNIIVDNTVRNSANGIIVEGYGNYIANNILLHNRYGFLVEGQYSLYWHNVIGHNYLGARGMSLLPTNRVTANDFVGNTYYAAAKRYNVLHIWRENFWYGAPGFDIDGNGYLDRTFRASGPVDGIVMNVAGARTLAKSPALQLLRQLQKKMPGLRQRGILDPRPRASSVHHQLVTQVIAGSRQPGQYDDGDDWDFEQNTSNVTI